MEDPSWREEQAVPRTPCARASPLFPVVIFLCAQVR